MPAKKKKAWLQLDGCLGQLDCCSKKSVVVLVVLYCLYCDCFKLILVVVVVLLLSTTTTIAATRPFCHNFLCRAAIAPF